MPNVICISGGGQRLEPLQNGRFPAKIAIPKKGAENDPRSSLELCAKHHSKKTPNIRKKDAVLKWPKLATTIRLEPLKNGQFRSTIKNAEKVQKRTLLPNYSYCVH